MDAKIESVLHRLYLDDDRQRREGHPVSDRTRNLTRVSGEYLSILARAMNAKRVVEIGSSNGVSTIWFAAAVRATGGFVTGTEILVERAAVANANLAEADLSEFGRVLPGDAQQALASIEPGIDIAFVDAEKEDYVAHFEVVWSKVRVGGVVIADNVTSHDLSDYQAMVRRREDCDTVTATIERGLEITIKTR